MKTRSYWFILIVLLMVSCKSVETTTTINASSDKVWNVLLDTNKYREWNPVMELLEGELKEGNKVKYKVIELEGKESKIKARVTKVEANKLLNQKGGVPLLIRFNHKYILKPIGNKTEVIIKEKYSGIYVPFWSSKNIKDAYKRLNESLKLRVENLN